MPWPLVLVDGQLQESTAFGGGGYPAINGEPNGFTDRSQVALAWNDATRTLSIAPVGASFYVYVDGTLYTKSAPESIQVPNSEGRFVIYYAAGGALTVGAAVTDEIILRWAIVATGYWDAANARAIPNVFAETHGHKMPPAVHYYLHYALGMQYKSGLQLAATATGNGSLDSHCQFSSSAGAVLDEDIEHAIAASELTTPRRILYREGAGGNWRMSAPTSFLVLMGASLAQYNSESAGTWALTQASSGNFVLAHAVAMPGVNHTQGALHIVLGQAAYVTSGTARGGAMTELARLKLDGLPGPEFRFIATFIIETKSSLTNSVHSRIVATSTGLAFIDWRAVDPLQASSIAAMLGA